MSRRKRRKFSAEYKAEIVLSVLTGEKSQAEVCREQQLSAQQFGNWKRQFLENAASAFEKPETSEEKAQIAELERMVGRLTMQLDIAKKASSILGSPSTKNGTSS
ncbi:MAG: transposase [Chloroflexota bacterium]